MKANTAHQSFDPSISHIPSLDGVRGLAILLVLVVHCYYRGPDISVGSFVSNFIIFGWTGVELFFVLSGFLITSLIKDAIKKPSGFWDFIVKRVSRIFPLYFAIVTAFCLASYSVSSGLLGDSLQNLSQHWYVYALFFSNYAEVFSIPIADANKLLGPAWSLATEQQYYLLWPLVILAASKRAARLISIAAILLLPIIRGIATQYFDPTVIYHASIFHADGLLIGSAVALWLPELIKIRSLHLSATVIFGTAMVAMFVWLGTTHYSDSGVQVFGYLVISFFYACFILAVMTTPVLCRIFSNYVLRMFGKYAYSIYLLHWPVLIALDQLPLPSGFHFWLLFTTIFSFATLALGHVSWVLIELPASRAIRRGLLRQKQPQAMAVPPR